MQRYKLQIFISDTNGEPDPALVMEFNATSDHNADRLRRYIQDGWVHLQMNNNDYRCWMSKITQVS